MIRTIGELTTRARRTYPVHASARDGITIPGYVVASGSASVAAFIIGNEVGQLGGSFTGSPDLPPIEWPLTKWLCDRFREVEPSGLFAGFLPIEGAP